MGTKGQWCLLVIFSLGGEPIQIVAHCTVVSQIRGSLIFVGIGITWENRTYTKVQGDTCGSSRRPLCSLLALRLVMIHPNSESHCPESEGCFVLFPTALWLISPFLNTTGIYLLSSPENPQRDSNPLYFLAPNTLNSLFEPLIHLHERFSSAFPEVSGWALFSCPLSRCVLCLPFHLVLLPAGAPWQHLVTVWDFAALIENFFSSSLANFVSFKCSINDVIILNIPPLWSVLRPTSRIILLVSKPLQILQWLPIVSWTATHSFEILWFLVYFCAYLSTLSPLE